MPTKNEEKEIIRVCGENYLESDIPAFIRDRDRAEELAKQEAYLEAQEIETQMREDNY